MKVTFNLNPCPPGGWNLPDKPEVAALWQRFHLLFADWKPQRHADTPESPEHRFYSFEAKVGDRMLGDYQCVDLRGDDGDPTAIGRLIEFHHEESDYEPVAKSLAERLRELADGLEAGTYQYDEDNGIERIE